MARKAEGAAAGTVRPPISTTALGLHHVTPLSWQAQLLASRFSVSIEAAAVIAALALGGAHG